MQSPTTPVRPRSRRLLVTAAAALTLIAGSLTGASGARAAGPLS